MKPPYPWRITDPHKGFSLCDGCSKWKRCLNFYHEGRRWILCQFDYADYWENTDELQEDYKPPTDYRKVGRLRL